ncbi:MAG: PAS domain S-box protein, partial [Actinobacteria bacterium]|nr:PAS domain S-box protein [Actinomycetota bacterium]
MRSFARVDRYLLDGVLAVVRQLGASTSLPETFDLILKGIVEVVGFDAAALNVTTAEGDLRVDAVNGPPGTEELLGTRRPMDVWLQLLTDSEPWGALRFYSHERPQGVMERYAFWRADRDADPDPEAWHPDDSLLAPLWGADGRLIGVIGVDEPRSGRRPDAEQRMILEVFAGQAAKAIVDARTRAQRERERRIVEERWRLAFEHSPTGMAVLTSERGVLDVNDALVSMLRTSRETLLRVPWADYTHPDDLEADMALFREVLEGRRDGYQMEKRYIRGEIAHRVN